MRWFLPLLIVLGIGAGIIVFNVESVRTPPGRTPGTPSPANPSPSSATSDIPRTSSPARTASTLKSRKRYVLFFAVKGDRGLRLEPRDLPRPRTLRESIRLVLEELILGSRTGLVETLPRTSKVLEIFLDGQGTVYVDFSKDISTDHPGGVWTESVTVASVVQTLTFNFESVRKVAFLIEGKTAETLTGHIDIQRPLSRLDTSFFPQVDEP